MTKELPLFSDDSCFVEEDPKSCGFYDIEGPDLKRWIEAKAVCRCRLDVGVGYTTPCLMVRADARKTEWGPYLMPSVEGRGVGLERIQGYGAYYFPFPAELLAAQRTRDSVEVRLETLFAPDARGGDSRQIALAIFELRIVDLNRDSFPERQEFLLQRKIFEPGPGGQAADILTGHMFHPSDRVLDLGAGSGWTTMLLAGFSGASVWGIDLCDYPNAGCRSFRAELLQRFDRHRAALLPVASLAPMADRMTLEKTVTRCHFEPMNAEEMSWRDDYFDFVFSLNVFEHVGRPERVLAEIHRVLRPGGRALVQFSPLYYSDSGSHLPSTLRFERPWAHLLMSREEIKAAICASGGVPFEVDAILDSLNGWKPGQFIDLFENSGMHVLTHGIHRGFTLPNAEQSPEFALLRARYARDDLTTIGMLWHLEKRGTANG